MKLKKKYTDRKQSTGGSTVPTGNNKSKPLSMEKSRMKNPMARKLYFDECWRNGHMEQLPPMMRGKKRKAEAELLSLWAVE